MYHNKEICFTRERLTEPCTLGIHADIIIPHSWIVKLPRKGSFKSSIRRTTKSKRTSSKKKPKREDDQTTGNQISSTMISQNVLQNISQNIPQNIQQQTIQQQSSITNENSQIINQFSSLQQQQSIDTPGFDTSTSSGSGSGHLSSVTTAFTYNTLPSQLPVNANLNDSPPVEMISVTNEQQPIQQQQQQNQLNTTNYATSCPITNCTHSTPHHKSFAIKPIPSSTSRPLLVRN